MAYGYGKGYGYSYGLADPVSLILPLDQVLPWVEASDNVGVPATRTIGPVQLVHEPDQVIGDFLDTQPIEGLGLPIEGLRQFSYFDDFYERFYIIPRVIDFGIIVGDTTRQMTVWNAHLTSGSLEMVDQLLPNEEGVSIAHPTLPQPILPLALVPYTATADTQGTTEIESSAFFTFEPAQNIEVYFLGVRGRLWPFTPNWSQSFTQQWEYKTEIITSRSGREQRLATRSTPRKSVEFTCQAAGDRLRDLNRMLSKFQHVDHVVPDIPRHVRALTPVTAAPGMFAVSDTPSWLKPNMLVVLVSGRKIDMRYVSAVGLGSITLEDEGTLDFDVDTKICYAFVGNLSDSLTTRRLTNEATEIAVRFDARPGREDEPDYGTPAETYLGREVFLTRPTWSDAVQIDYTRPTEIIDFGRGVVRRYNPVGYGSRLFRATWLNADYTITHEIEKLFLRMRGQRGEFLMPTFEDDLPVALDINNATAIIRIKGTEAADIFANDRVFKNIMVLLKDGTRIYRRVATAFTVGDVHGDDTIFQLTQLWSSNIAVSDIHMVCWMPVCRFASDAITIEWLTDTKSRIQLAIKTLEDLTAET